MNEIYFSTTKNLCAMKRFHGFLKVLHGTFIFKSVVWKNLCNCIIFSSVLWKWAPSVLFSRQLQWEHPKEGLKEKRKQKTDVLEFLVFCSARLKVRQSAGAKQMTWPAVDSCETADLLSAWHHAEEFQPVWQAGPAKGMLGTRRRQ